MFALPANFLIWESHGLILIGKTIPHIDVKHMEVTGNIHIITLYLLTC